MRVLNGEGHRGQKDITFIITRPPGCAARGFQCLSAFQTLSCEATRVSPQWRVTSGGGDYVGGEGLETVY